VCGTPLPAPPPRPSPRAAHHPAGPSSRPRPPRPQTKTALPTLARLIHHTDEEVLTDACWALSYLSDGDNDRIDKVIEAGVCRRLVELLL
jgi:hypothetical protein